jgi:hypothetical protein
MRLAPGQEAFGEWLLSVGEGRAEEDDQGQIEIL